MLTNIIVSNIKSFVFIVMLLFKVYIIYNSCNCNHKRR